MNLANEIKRLAVAEGMTYWEFVKERQGSLRLPFRYERVKVRELLEMERAIKEKKRKEKYGEGV